MIDAEELPQWLAQYENMNDTHLGHHPCGSCRSILKRQREITLEEELRETKKAKRASTSTATSDVNKDIKLSAALHSKIKLLKGQKTFEHFISDMCDIYMKYSALDKEKNTHELYSECDSYNTKEYECATCKFLNGNIATSKLEHRDIAIQCDEPSTEDCIKTVSNLEFKNNKLTFKVRENNTSKGMGALSLRMEYLAAKLLHSQILPARINRVLQAVAETFGIEYIGSLPSLEQYIIIIHRYAIYGDMYFIHRTKGCDLAAIIDDFSRMFRANQVVGLVALVDDKTVNHVADISRVREKTVDCKFNSLLVTKEYYAAASRILNKDISDDEADILLRIVAKMSDRFIVEQLLGAKLDEYVNKHGKSGVVSVYCAAHLGNTAVEAASAMRAKDGTVRHDPGYKLCRTVINVYRSSKFLKGAMQLTTGKIFHFTKEITVRFYQNMNDMKELFELIDVLRDSFELLELFERASETLPKKETLEVKSMLACSEHITGLWVNTLEVIKILKPYLQLLQAKKEAFGFYPALIPVVDEMKNIISNADKLKQFVLANDVHIFDKQYVEHQMPRFRNSVVTQLAVEQTRITLSAWVENMEKVLVEFRRGAPSNGIGDDTPDIEYLEQISARDADLLKGKRLDKYLQAFNISKSGTADNKRFKVKSYLKILSYTEDQKRMMRENVIKMLGDPQNIVNRIMEDLNAERSPSYLPEKCITSSVMDWESCYSSPKFKNSQLKRLGGRLFYQACKINVFEQRGCWSFARRDYIQPLPASAKNREKFKITADSPEIRNAFSPEEVMRAWERYDEELNVYGNLLLFYWASSNFDINMLQDALEECGAKNPGFVTYANAMKLVRYLIPGMESYALENIHRALGFGDYGAHDASEDCLATWRVLLYAVHCYIGPNMELTEDLFHTIVLHLLEMFDAYLCEFSDSVADDLESSQ